MNEDEDTRQQAEEDAKEDLELADEEAARVRGGAAPSPLPIPYPVVEHAK